jgi:hypothetical protein
VGSFCGSGSGPGDGDVGDGGGDDDEDEEVIEVPINHASFPRRISPLPCLIPLVRFICNFWCVS